MKRSTQLILLASAGAALLVYRSSGNTASKEKEDVEAMIFNNAEECKNLGIPASTCDESFAVATVNHISSAPRYESKTDCEKDFGADQCEITSSPSSSSSSMFSPIVVGYMLGRFLNNTSSQHAALSPQPVYGCNSTAINSVASANSSKCYSGRTGRYFFSFPHSSSAGTASFKTSSSFFNSGRYNVVPKGQSITHQSGGVRSRGGFGSSSRGFSSSGG